MNKTVLFLISLTLLACNSDMNPDFPLDRSSKISIVLLNSNNSLEGSANSASSERVELSEDQKSAFIKEVLDDSNYISMPRKCKFDPVYAIEVDGKIEAHFDLFYCPTIQYSKKGKPIHLDLKEDNGLIPIIRGMFKGDSLDWK